MTRFDVLASASADANVNLSPAPSATKPKQRTALAVAAMAIALAALFHINLIRLWQVINPVSGDPTWGHAVYLPFVSLAYLSLRKQQLARLRAHPVWPALLVILGGIATFAYGICMSASYPGLSSFVQDMGMILTLFAVVLCLFGWSISRFALFPIGYLLCGIPWPPTLIDVTTAPLQHLAATTSIWILGFSPLNVEQAGNTIHVLAQTGPDRVLEVAEACSGLRSIAVFIAIGLAVAFLPERPLWRSIIISLFAVLIAITCNVMRIVGDVLLDHYVSHTLSEGFYHSFTGVVLLVPGVFLFLLVAKILDVMSARPVAASQGTLSTTQPSTEAIPPKFNAMADRPFRRMYFTALAIVTIAAGVFGLTTHILQLHFQKSPVPLPLPLTDLPANIGPWRWIGKDQPLQTDVQAMLGTDQYIFRDYLDDRQLGSDSIDAMARNADPDKAVAAVAVNHANASVHLSLTYYTGRVDSVSHIPERCYVGGGEASSTQSVQATWNVAGHPLVVRLVTIDTTNATPGAIRYVAYCYRVNGRYESESWRVRQSLINVFNRFAWYAKIEVATPVADKDAATKVLTDFLSTSLPAIEARLPAGTAPVVHAGVSE